MERRDLDGIIFWEICEGWGVEDIAVRHGLELESVRMKFRRLRRAIELELARRRGLAKL